MRVRYALFAALLGAASIQVGVAEAAPIMTQAGVVTYPQENANPGALRLVRDRDKHWRNDDYDDDYRGGYYRDDYPRWRDRHDYRRFSCRPLNWRGHWRHGYYYRTRELLCHDRYGYSFVVPANRFWYYD